MAIRFRPLDLRPCKLSISSTRLRTESSFSWKSGSSTTSRAARSSAILSGRTLRCVSIVMMFSRSSSAGDLVSGPLESRKSDSDTNAALHTFEEVWSRHNHLTSPVRDAGEF